MKPPVVIDLFCGLGGFSEGFIAEGYRCVGYDIEAHDYGTGGYPGTLILRDVRSITGEECKDAAIIVASPPCQGYSYRAMPWKRAKALPPPDNTLFNECFRIQREASEAAGHYIPLIVENVRGAQKWVGRARWNYGSFYLWGDVPALMPIILKRAVMKEVIAHRANSETNFHASAERATRFEVTEGYKTSGMNWSDQTKRGQDFTRIAGQQAMEEYGRKASMNFHEHEKTGKPGRSFQSVAVEDTFGWSKDTPLRNNSSKSSARKRASAMIAKIPEPLSRHIARVFKPIK